MDEYVTGKRPRKGQVISRRGKKFVITEVYQPERRNGKLSYPVAVSAQTKNPAKGARVAVLRTTTGYKDRAGKFHAGYPATARKTAVKKKAARKNPVPSFPVGKFVKVDAVKVNRNGTIDIMRSKSKRPKR